MMYPFYYYVRAEAETGILSDLEKAINGEYSAIVCYEQLAGLAPTEEERRRILEIRQDEMRHLHVFSQLYRTFSGKQPEPKQTQPCAADYTAGLQAALKDEQETVDFYLAVSDKTQDPAVREPLRRVAADEQNHAVWFLYYWTKRCCGN